MSDTICPVCLYEPPTHDGPGIAVRMPGTVHRADCPRVAWIGKAAKRISDEHTRTNHGLLRSPGEVEAERARRENAELRRRIERLEADRG